MNAFALYEENLRRHRDMVCQEAAYRSKQELRSSYASAMQQVCTAMASSLMVGAVFIADPAEAAKSFGDSMKWQMAGILSTMGDPEMVSKFLCEESP